MKKSLIAKKWIMLRSQYQTSPSEPLRENEEGSPREVLALWANSLPSLLPYSPRRLSGVPKFTEVEIVAVSVYRREKSS